MERPRTVLWLLFALPTLATAAHADLDRPGADAGPTRVEIVVFVIDVDSVDDANQTFSANFYLGVKWRDPRLAHEGPGPKTLPLTEVWHPQLTVLNRQKLWATFPDVVEVSPEGRVMLRQRYWGQLSQPLDLRDFPFDRQTFTFTLVSVGHGPGDVALVMAEENPSGVAEALSIPDWSIVGWSAGAFDYLPLPGASAIAGYRFSFEGERRTGFYIVKVITPLLFIVAMSWIAFWIDPKESGSQISVSVTSMLTLIAYRFAVGATIPKVSYLTRLDHFILVSTILVFATLVEVVVTSTLAKRDRLETARRIDRWARFVFPVCFAIVTLRSLVV